MRRRMPEIPDTGWKTPTDFPNLSSAKAISFDVETWDPELGDAGPGWGRHSGHIVGASLGTDDGGKWYFPMRHTIEPETNMDPGNVLRYLDHVLHDDRPKVGANLIYDLGWLKEEGVRVGGRLMDVQFAEALLNSEEPSVSLESLSQKYLGVGKASNLLYEWCAAYYGGKPGPRQRANIYRSPPRLVGHYGEEDAALPIQIMLKQWKLLEDAGQLELFEMECGLIRLLVDMRMKGAPVDLARTETLVNQFDNDAQLLAQQLQHLAGFEVNPNASDSLSKAFDVLGLPITRNKEGKPTFEAHLLEAIDHPFTTQVLDWKRKVKLRDTFLKSYILNKHVNGRLHCSFHPLKTDDSGTRSGRFASTDPNLQNIPARTEEGRMIRSCFVAQGRWRKYDHSQIEYRMMANHAVGPGSDDIRARFCNDRSADYHNVAIDLVLEKTGLVIKRPQAKTVNFGLIYGMTEPKLAVKLGLDNETAKKLFAAYHEGLPFAKATMDACADEVNNFGFVTTILGRRSHFDLWEPALRGNGPRLKALPLRDAQAQYGFVKRAFLHKALNRKLQGGAADVMKKGMYECYRQGVFDATGIPLLTVHDELDFDDVTGNEEAFAEMVHVLETCIPQIRVPLRVDMNIGPNWGSYD